MDISVTTTRHSRTPVPRRVRVPNRKGIGTVVISGFSVGMSSAISAKGSTSPKTGECLYYDVKKARAVDE